MFVSLSLQQAEEALLVQEACHTQEPPRLLPGGGGEIRRERQSAIIQLLYLFHVQAGAAAALDHVRVGAAHQPAAPSPADVQP